MTADVARYFLHEDHAPERVKAAYDEARKFAEAVARGDASLGDQVAATPAPDSGLPLVEGPEAVFGRTAMQAL
jgi:phage gp36-like protein